MLQKYKRKLLKTVKSQIKEGNGSFVDKYKNKKQKMLTFEDSSNIFDLEWFVIFISSRIYNLLIS